MSVQPLWLESYLFELPFDSGVPDGFAFHRKDDPHASVEEGWEGFDLSRFLGLTPSAVAPQMCSTTVAFQRGTVPVSASLDAVESAFPAFIRAAELKLPTWERLFVRSPLETWRRRLAQPPRASRTVVQAARIALPPEPEGDEALWRDEQITISLRRLNEYLEGVAAVRTNLAVGPVRVPDLAPFTFGFRMKLPDALSDLQGRREHFTVLLHEYFPSVTEPLTREQAEEAWRWSNAREQVLWAAMRWMRDAERSYMRESLEHAVLEAGTAIELAVSDAVRHCAPLAGYARQKVDHVLDGNFTTRVQHHFATLLGFDNDPSSAVDALGLWWRQGYALRNRVVHRGCQPTREESATAVRVANALLDEAIDRIRADARFQMLLPPAAPRSGS